jgi:NADPH:quinone reductase-like Zn-dependent oxidoreductase
MSRSVRIHEFGGPEVLKIEDIVVPVPESGEVRLRVRAIGLNRSEVLFRSGRAAVTPPLPSLMGLEAAGEVDAVGPDVDNFDPGDRVSIIPGFGGAGQYGYYGEVSLAPTRALVRVPANTSWSDAAATWMAFGTAWAGLIDIARLSAGQVVLVSAASSSTGLAGIQVARKVGAIPIALTRTSTKAKALLSAGAAHVIATQEQDLVSEVARLTDGKGAEVAFDPIGGPTFGQLAQAVTSGAILVVYGRLNPDVTPLPLVHVIWKRLTIRGFGLPSVVADAGKFTAMKHFISEGLAAGVLKPTIAKIFSFDEIAAAHRYLENGEQIGKVIVAI